MLRLIFSLLVLFGGIVSPAVNATDLYGKISLSSEFRKNLAASDTTADDSQYRGYWNEPNAVLPIASPSVNIASDFGVVLFREGADTPKADPVKSVNVLTGELEKNVIVIRPKSRIKFIMRSPYDHELYSPSKHDFKPQKQGNNSFRPIDFYSAGIFEVKCKLFPHFQGWVVVVPATYVLKIDKNGAFKFDNAEPGKYRMKVFYKGKWIFEKAFEVEGRKKEMNASIKNTLDSVKKDETKAPSKKKKKEHSKKVDRKDK